MFIPPKPTTKTHNSVIANSQQGLLEEINHNEQIV